MKKFFSLLLAVLLVASLAACGGGSGSEGGSNAPADSGTSAPADTGSGSKAEAVDTNTVAVGAVVIARDDVSEDDVYKFVSTIFENTDAITEQHAKGGELDLTFASSVTSVPYHPGAAKYFQEKGIEVAAVKEGAGAGESKALTFTTGGETGTYYAFGGVLASYVSNNGGVNVTAVVGNGSQSNVEDLTAGDVQLGFVQSDVMSYAYNGERLFDSPVTNFSVVAALYMEQVQIATTNPDIKSVADLEGKIVSIGASGSGVYFNAIDVLGAYGLTEEDIQPVFQSFGDSADNLKDGKIDAAFIVAGAPTPAISDLALSKPTYLVGLDEEHTNSLLESSPFYSAYTIPAGTY
ncbi:TAXI family TRAP transporter solute-binding subunit [uncultured Oscillibacter sp.]|uniref:TAXI family TRAP transporter solute-binding subunit n=1 Tax=uncultured Oscillibacter sp. TaxID=876091 RepID=UPI00262D0122|nr:TAXI family TRAP transporter solute-binding subunit [uncultured Oscillibacter sp.]